jgi:hypothetical protein
MFWILVQALSRIVTLRLFPVAVTTITLYAVGNCFIDPETVNVFSDMKTNANLIITTEVINARGLIDLSIIELEKVSIIFHNLSFANTEALMNTKLEFHTIASEIADKKEILTEEQIKKTNGIISNFSEFVEQKRKLRNGLIYTAITVSITIIAIAVKPLVFGVQ